MTGCYCIRDLGSANELRISPSVYYAKVESVLPVKSHMHDDPVGSKTCRMCLRWLFICPPQARSAPSRRKHEHWRIG